MGSQKTGSRNQSIEKLEEKAVEAPNGLFFALRSEKMRIRREELQKEIGAHSENCAPVKPRQGVGGENE